MRCRQVSVCCSVTKLRPARLCRWWLVPPLHRFRIFRHRCRNWRTEFYMRAPVLRDQFRTQHRRLRPISTRQQRDIRSDDLREVPINGCVFFWARVFCAPRFVLGFTPFFFAVVQRTDQQKNNYDCSPRHGTIMPHRCNRGETNRQINHTFQRVNLNDRKQDGGLNGWF